MLFSADATTSRHIEELSGLVETLRYNQNADLPQHTEPPQFTEPPKFTEPHQFTEPPQHTDHPSPRGTLKEEFARQERLNVKRSDDKTWEFTQAEDFGSIKEEPSLQRKALLDEELPNSGLGGPSRYGSLSSSYGGSGGMEQIGGLGGLDDTPRGGWGGAAEEATETPSSTSSSMQVTSSDLPWPGLRTCLDINSESSGSQINQPDKAAIARKNKMVIKKVKTVKTNKTSELTCDYCDKKFDVRKIDTILTF